MSFAEDVTAQTSSRLLFYSDFLQRAGALLGCSLDYDRTLPEMGSLVVPMFADWCVIDLVRPTGEFERVLLRQDDPDKRPIESILTQQFAPDGVRAHPVNDVLASGTSQLVREVTEAWIRAHTYDERHAETFRATGVHSALFLPLHADGEMIGVMSLHVCDPERPGFDEHDLRVAELLASLVACAIRNARYTTELQAELNDRRALEQRLQQVIREQESRVQELRTLMETVPAGVLIAGDRACSTIVGNREAYRQLRLPRESASLSATGEDGTLPAPFEIRRNGVRVVPSDMPMQRAAREGISTRSEEQEVAFADGSRAWLAVSATPLLDEEGRPRGAVGASLDITRIKQIEADLLERQEELEDEIHERTRAMIETHQRLREMERMATIGTLSAGLGHDMGNLLLPLRLRLDSLSSMALPDPAPSDLAAIATVLEYLQRLATGLRSLAVDPNKPDRQTHAETKLRVWWTEVHTLMRNAVPPGVALQAIIPARLPPLRISAAALTQTVLNIVQNGGQALRGQPGARIVLRAEALADRGEVRLTIADNGPGMDEQARRHCFEPFFSTKKRQISTGLGLAVVRAVVTGIGGQVAVESTPGSGATFILTIPAHPRASTRARQERPRDRQALLTVADPRQRALIASVLRHDGFSVRHGEHDPEDTCQLWVTDAASPRPATDLLAFVNRDEQRVALVVNVAASPVRHPRIRAVDSASDLTGLRAAISTVARDADAHGHQVD